MRPRTGYLAEQPDPYAPNRPDWIAKGYRFDHADVERVIRFGREYVRHYKGKRFAGTPFELEWWQRERIVAPIFGWKRPDGRRLIRTVYIEIPRKNGKSTLAAFIAAVMMFLFPDPGGQSYTAAAAKGQARIVFDHIRRLVLASPRLAARAIVKKAYIEYPGFGYTCAAISADADLQEGFDPHFVCIDEMHKHKTRDLYDALATSFGSADFGEPLFFIITTAGRSKISPCGEIHDYARGVLNGTIPDDSFFAFICGADENDDCTKEATWEKTNPGLDRLVSREFLRTEFKKAIEIPSQLPSVCNRYCNLWISDKETGIDMVTWGKLEEKYDLESLKGRRVVGGLDLATSSDLAAFVLLVSPEDPEERFPLYTWPFIYAPQEGIDARGRRDRVPYAAWADDRFRYLRLTPGPTIDWGYIENDLLMVRDEFHLLWGQHDQGPGKDLRVWRVGTDPSNAWSFLKRMKEEHGMPLAIIDQSYKRLSPPSKMLERLIAEKKIRHPGNPLFTWTADNVRWKRDSNGYIMPDKDRGTRKIDPMSALVMAVEQWMRTMVNRRRTPKRRGLRTVQIRRTGGS